MSDRPPTPGGRPGRITEIRAARAGDPDPADAVILPHDRRRVRRKVVKSAGDINLIFDFAEPLHLHHGDRIVLSDGLHVEVIAEEEDLFAVTARDAAHLIELAWHIGNRHVPAQIEATRLLIAREPVLAEMLRGLGAAIDPVRAPFEPLHGAYHHAHD